MIKADLRKAFLDRRRSLTNSERSMASRQISDRFFDTVDLTSVAYLHCYIPISKFNEIDTSMILERVCRDHPQIRTVVPRIDSVMGELENLLYDSSTEMIVNDWGISEPAHNMHIAPERIDVVLLPLLCFDTAGHRVGYGKGFYDRFLARCRPDCIKAGLSYFPPVNYIDDASDLDIPLDLCVTPAAVYRFK